MAKFDYKKWVIENKLKNIILNEQRMRRMRMRDRGETNPLTMCSVSVTDPVTGVGDLNLCHRFSECVNGQNMGGNEVIFNGDPFANPQDFYNSMCPGCVPGDVIEMSDGRKWIYEGTGTNAVMNTITPKVSLVGPSTSIMSVMGCMDPLANNFNAASTVDDGSCAYGYDCNQKGNHPKFGSKCTPNMDPGTNGTFQTLQSCIASGCEGLRTDIEPGFDDGNKVPNDGPVDVEPTAY